MSLSFSHHLSNAFTYCPSRHFKAHQITNRDFSGKPWVYLGLAIAYVPIIGAVTSVGIGIFNRAWKDDPREGNKILGAFLIRASLSLVVPFLLPVIDAICSLRHRMIYKDHC